MLAGMVKLLQLDHKELSNDGKQYLINKPVSEMGNQR